VTFALTCPAASAVSSIDAHLSEAIDTKLRRVSRGCQPVPSPVSGRGRGGTQAGPIQPVVPARYQFNGTFAPGRPEAGGAERSESERAGGRMT
jgi:hypothetical protein